MEYLHKDMEQICDNLMDEVKRSYAQHGKLSDDLLSSLNFIFQGTLLSALELVENSSVTKVISPSGRNLFQVIGASGTPYTCFPDLIYCSCPAYNFSVLRKEDNLMCKHILAIKLSEAMGLLVTLDVHDAEITKMILAMD